MVKPSVCEFVVVQPGIAQVSFSYHGVLSRGGEGAMPRWSDHGILLAGNLWPRCPTNIVVGRKVWPDRYVIPRHQPQARDIDRHIIMPEATLIPGRIIGHPSNQCASTRNRSGVGEDSAGGSECSVHLLFRKMPEERRPVDGRKMRVQIEVLRCPHKIV